MLRLIGRDDDENTVDHFLCVNGINNSLIDSAAPKQLMMDHGVLQGCVNALDEVRYFRELLLQPRGKRSRKSRTNRKARACLLYTSDAADE